MSEIVSEIQDDGFFQGEEWLREATPLEKAMEVGHQDGHLLLWYQIDLSSEEPLREDDVRTALTHLYRKTPNLGVCYGMREGAMWLKKVTDPNVDFQVLKGLAIEEVREILRNYHYSSDTGPLFCTRLLQESPDNPDTEDLEPSLPHKSYLFFGTHHGPTDGNCNMDIIGYFITLLNCVISCKPINDEVTLGTFISDEMTNNLVLSTKTLLQENATLQQKLQEDNDLLETQTALILKAFPAPENEEERTASMVKVFDQVITSKLIYKCKTEKVTINSALTALVNVAIVDTLIERDFIQESYVIQNFHIVNLRRYLNVTTPESLGVHVALPPLKMYTSTPRKVEGQFWEYAKSLHEAIRHEIDSDRVLFNQAHKLLNAESDVPTEASKTESICGTGDFITSNLGDVTAAVTIGDKIKITNVFGGATFHKTEHPVLITCTTFRGRFNIVFDYVTKFVQASVAERIFFNLAARLYEMVE